MKIGHTIDENGFLTGDILEESGITPDVSEICPDGFYKPKWTGLAWVEGLTPAEIEALRNVTPPPDRITELEQTVASLTQILAEKGITP